MSIGGVEQLSAAHLKDLRPVTAPSIFLLLLYYPRPSPQGSTRTAQGFRPSHFPSSPCPVSPTSLFPEHLIPLQTVRVPAPWGDSHNPLPCCSFIHQGPEPGSFSQMRGEAVNKTGFLPMKLVFLVGEMEKEHQVRAYALDTKV